MPEAARRRAGEDEGAEAVRLFVAVWPPPMVLGALAAVDRPAVAGVRWATADQWHVTLRFLGRVAAEAVDGVVAALAPVVASVPAPHAELGRATEVLGRHVLVVPVAGLDALGEAVRTASLPAGEPAGTRPFHGHLTVARARRGMPGSVHGLPVGATDPWPVRSVALVASDLTPEGARYRTVVDLPLG